MKSKISAGCQASNLLILFVLVIEYGLFFLAVPFEKVSALMMLGYTFLTYTITCNNHGRNVHLYYERELSLVLKGIITDFVMGVFLYAIYSDGNKSCGAGVLSTSDKWWIGYFIMVLSILYLFSYFVLFGINMCIQEIKEVFCIFMRKINRRI